MIDLIYDRTTSDVTRLDILREKVKNRTATEEEISEWLTPLKGAYNYSDLNRVGEAINYLADLFNDYGYENVISAKTNWTINDKPNPAQMSKYISDVNELKNVYFVLSTTPQTPSDMVSLTYTEANNIEKILVDIDFILNNMKNYFVYCGVGRCGQNRLWQQRFRRADMPNVIDVTWDSLDKTTWDEFEETDLWDTI